MPTRFDLLFMPQGGGYALADAAPRAVLGSLANLRLIEPFEERVGVDDVEVYSRPGLTAHQVLGPGEAPAETPFFECVFRFGAKRKAPYGDLSAHFWLEIRGCLTAEIDGKIRQKLCDVLGSRLQTVTQPHTAIPERPDFPPRPAESVADAVPMAPVGTRVEDL